MSGSLSLTTRITVRSNSAPPAMVAAAAAATASAKLPVAV